MEKIVAGDERTRAGRPRPPACQVSAPWVASRRGLRGQLEFEVLLKLGNRGERFSMRSGVI